MLQRAESRDRNTSLDLLRGLGCFCVVFIHVHFPGILGKVLSSFSQWAVPVFLMISGYFLFKQTNNSDKTIVKQQIRKRIKRVSILLLAGLCIGIIFRLLAKNPPAFKYDMIFNMLLLNDYDFFSCGHLWYLGGILYFFLIWDKIRIFQSRQYLYFLATLILIFSAIFLSSADVCWHYRGNWLNPAFAWLIIGMFFAKYQFNMHKIFSTKILIIMLFLAIFFSCFYKWFMIAEFGRIIIAISLFLLALRFPHMGDNKYLTYIGKRYSDWIYVLHPFVGTILTVVARKGFYTEISLYYFMMISPILTCVLTLFIAIMWSRIRNYLKIYLKLCK